MCLFSSFRLKRRAGLVLTCVTAKNGFFVRNLRNLCDHHGRKSCRNLLCVSLLMQSLRAAMPRVGHILVNLRAALHAHINYRACPGVNATHCNTAALACPVSSSSTLPENCNSVVKRTVQFKSRDEPFRLWSQAYTQAQFCLFLILNRTVWRYQSRNPVFFPIPSDQSRSFRLQ